MDYNWDFNSESGKQEFANWVDRMIKNEVNSYSRQVLGASNTTGLANNSGSLTGVGSVNNAVIPPGVIAPFSGINLPDGWLFCNNQTIDRNVYSNLFNSITISLSNASLNSTTTISGLTNVNTSDWLGWGVAGDGIPSGAIISSLTSTTIVLNVAATKTGTKNIVIGPYGFTGADNISTFNVPDLRGRMPAGRDTMASPGGAASRITTSTIPTYGGNILGKGGGNQLMSHTHSGYSNGGDLRGAIGAWNNSVTAIGYEAIGAWNPAGGGIGATYAISGGAVGFGNWNHFIPVYGYTSDGSNINNLQPTLITNYIIKT